MPNAATLYSETHKQQPHCRYCGAKLKRMVEKQEFLPARPRTREDAQRMTNHQIVSVQWGGPEGDRFIKSATIWDGETYKGGYFCKIQCAIDFAWCAARQGMETKAHSKATAYQRTPKILKTKPRKRHEYL